MILKAINNVKGFFKEEGKSAVYFDMKKGEELDVPESRVKELIGGGNFVDAEVDEITKEPTYKDKVPKEVKEMKDDFIKELQKIKGIGIKTSEDIIRIYSTREALVSGIREGRLPFRDDIEEKLKKKYGGD